MTLLKDKYRGTREYALVHAELITAARYRGTVTYQEVAQVMGLPLRGSHMAREVGQMLGSISEDEAASGRPMLSAIAVGVSGRPGDGFFGFARDLGKLKGEAREEEQRFWEGERAAVYETWARQLKEP